jgi:hypothetical protein
MDKTESRFQSGVDGVLDGLLDLGRGFVGGERLSGLLLKRRKRLSVDRKPGKQSVKPRTMKTSHNS